VQTLGTVALSLLLVLGPGLAWRHRHRTDFIAVLWPGPAWLALGGCVCWAAGGFVPPAATAVAWVGATLAVLVWLGHRDRPWRAWTPFEARVLALVALSVLGAAAKASFSGGPAGELYAGRVSRTLEAGDRPDSRISYHTVQLVAHHLAPYEPEAAKYFARWDFSGRGPLAGLAAAPLVLATGGRPPLEMPDQPWSPFDREGFAAYRIAMITLAALSLIAVAGLLLRVGDEQSAWLGISLVALTPFYWHELYFSWPKLASATLVLTAFHALLGGRVLVAALWLGAGYLCHPLALLSVPFLCLWLLLARPPSFWGRLARAATLGTGVLGVIVAWHAINGFQPSQGGFLQYPRAADGIYDVAPAAWWLSRWQSFANTFLPFHGLSSTASQLGFDAGQMDSGGTVRFFFQYWTSGALCRRPAHGAGRLAGLWPRVLAAMARGHGDADRPGSFSHPVLGRHDHRPNARGSPRPVPGRLDFPGVGGGWGAAPVGLRLCVFGAAGDRGARHDVPARLRRRDVAQQLAPERRLVARRHHPVRCGGRGNRGKFPVPPHAAGLSRQAWRREFRSTPRRGVRGLAT